MCVLVCLGIPPTRAAAQIGGITGTVVAAGSSAPLQNVQVTAVDLDGGFAGSAVTNAAGAYVIQPLASGSYHLYTSSPPGYVDEVFGGIPCLAACLPETALVQGQPVAVPATGVAPGVNFDLNPAARIAGRVTETGGTALSGVTIHAVTATGVLASSATSGAGGAYEITRLQAGSYFLFASSASGYLNQIYDGVSCDPSCSAGLAATRGTPVVAAAGGVAPGRDFALARGARITGRVTTAAGLPIPGVLVIAFNSAGHSFIGASGASGIYEITGLHASTYRVFTINADASGHLNEIFDNLPCPVRCQTTEALSSGAPVLVASASTASGIDFALAAGGRISGTITDAATGAPLSGIDVQVIGSTPTVVHLASAASTSASGAFVVTGLPPGTYHAYTMTPDGYINEIYGGIQCEGDCVEQQAAAGAPILVAPGGTTSGVDIALSRGGRIAGTVADAATSAGIQDAVVYVYDSRNRVVARGISDPAGAFLTSPGLASGIYYAVAAGYGGYLSEIFDNVSCGTSCFSGMAITAGSPIAVTAGTTTTGRHFTLQRGARIRGTIAQEGTGQPLGNASVRIFDDAGRLITSGTSNQDGSYVTELGLPGGVYFASTTNGIGHRDEIFDNQPCADDCASQVTTGTPIRVPDGTAQTVNLALAPATGPPDAPASLRSSNQAGGVLISWTASRGAAATSYRLEAGFAPGMTAVAIPVAGTSYLAAGVRPGVYFVRVRGVNAAGAGPASAEIAIGVGAGGIMTPGAPRFLFAAMTGRRLLLAWDEAGDGGAAVDYIIEAGNAAGAANIALIASDRRAFTFDPLPDGVYFLRVRARTPAGVGPPSNEVMLVVGGVASPPPAVERLGASSSSGTVVLSWLPPPGSVTGYVVEAGSAPGRSDLASALIGPGVSATFSGVPPGKYYVRLRGINAQGRGVASNEILVVVE